MTELRKVFDGDEDDIRDWIEDNAPGYSAYHAEDYDTLDDMGFGLWKEYPDQAPDWEGYIENGDVLSITNGVVSVQGSET